MTASPYAGEDRPTFWEALADSDLPDTEKTRLARRHKAVNGPGYGPYEWAPDIAEAGDQ